MGPLAHLLDSPAASRLGETLLHFTWQGAVVALIAVAVLAAMRRRGAAAARYAALLALLGMMVACPVATFAWITGERGAAPTQTAESGYAPASTQGPAHVPPRDTLWADADAVPGARELQHNGNAINSAPPVALAHAAPADTSEPAEDAAPTSLAPMSPAALVSRPAAIPGVGSWTIETREPRSAVHGIEYSPDGRYLATAGGDGTIRIWDSSTKRLVRALLGHWATTFRVEWSPDGTKLASTSMDKTVRLWDAESGRLLHTLGGHTNWVEGLTWSPDGTKVASTSWDRTVRIWDVDAGRELRSLSWERDLDPAVRRFITDARARPIGVAWSPHGTTLAAGGTDNVVVLWDPVTGQELRRLQGHEREVDALAWSPDGTMLASSGEDNTVRLWRAATGELLKTMSGHQNFVRTIAWSPDGEQIASGSHDGTVRLWDVQTGEQLRTMEGQSGHVWDVDFSPDGKTLVAGGHNFAGRFWNPTTGALEETIEGHPDRLQSVAFSPNGEMLAMASLDYTVRIWETGSARLKRSFVPFPSFAFTRHLFGLAFAPVAWSPDSSVLVFANDDGSVRLWDVKRDELSRTLRTQASRVVSLAWSPDGTLVASGGSDGAARVWDAQSGQALRAFEGHEDEVRGLAWSPDGKALATAGGGTLRIWDTETGEVQRSLEGHQGAIYALAWSPNGRFLAAGGSGGRRLPTGEYNYTAWIWDPAEGKVLHALTGHAFWIRDLAWSPDSRTLASVCRDNGQVRLWDPESGRLRGTLPGQAKHLHALSWSSDGGTLAIVPQASTVRLWDMNERKRRGALVMLRGGEGVSFSADGHYRGKQGVDDELVYVVQTDDGQEMLTPDEFAARYSWKNDPERVRLHVPPGRASGEESGEGK